VQLRHTNFDEQEAGAPDGTERQHARQPAGQCAS
jgi:hypothetical protein